MAKKGKTNQWLIYVVIGVGVVLTGMGVVPYIKGWWQTLQFERHDSVIYPLDMSEFVASLDANPKILGDFDTVTAQDPLIVDEIDYGNIENWFSSDKYHAQKQTSQSYTLDIEKLNIHNALVKVGGTNIDYNLVQFNTDVAIGDLGTPVIFGHSMLRQFYNPKETNKERYKGIFSTIMTLEKGDEIKVNVGDLTYTYEVVSTQTVQPDDEEIMRQDPSRKQLKLVTCTPEGTRLRRGIVLAELKK